MAQYSTFFIPHGDGGAQQEAMNAFLRGHRRRGSGSNRVLRGGSWNNNANNCRSANRNNNNPSNSNNNNGFRLCLPAAPQGCELAVPAGFPFATTIATNRECPFGAGSVREGYGRRLYNEGTRVI